MQGVACGVINVSNKNCSYIVEIADNAKPGLAGRFSKIKLMEMDNSNILASYDNGKWLVKPLNEAVDNAITGLIKRFE